MNNSTKLKSKNIFLPNWIDAEQFIENILTLEGPDLYSIFGFNDSTSCTKFLSRYIPNKPKNMKFSKYLRSVLDIENEVDVKVNTNIEINFKLDPKQEQQDKFMKIYKTGFFAKKDVALLSEEEQQKYKSFVESMEAEKLYNETAQGQSALEFTLDNSRFSTYNLARSATPGPFKNTLDNPNQTRVKWRELTKNRLAYFQQT